MPFEKLINQFTHLCSKSTAARFAYILSAGAFAKVLYAGCNSLIRQPESPLADTDTTRMINQRAKEMNIRAPIKVYMNRDRRAFASGEVILSSAAISLDIDDKNNEFVVLHELAHLKHHDALRRVTIDITSIALSLLFLNTNKLGYGLLLLCTTAYSFLQSCRAEERADQEAIQYCSYQGLAQGISFFENSRLTNKFRREKSIRNASTLMKPLQQLTTSEEGDINFILRYPFFDVHPTDSKRIDAIKKALTARQNEAPLVTIYWQDSANKCPAQIEIDGMSLREIIMQSNKQENYVALDKIILKPYRKNANVEFYTFGEDKPWMYYNFKNIDTLHNHPDEVINTLTVFFNQPSALSLEINVDAESMSTMTLKAKSLELAARALNTEIDSLRVVWPEKNTPDRPYCYIYADTDAAQSLVSQKRR